MEQTLLLNATYEPLKVVHWQKAMTLWCQGKVEVISVYDREVRSVSFSFKLPSVIRLLRYIRIKRQIESWIRESGLVHTVFRGSLFMDDWFALMGSSIPLRGAEGHTLRRPFWFSEVFRKMTGRAIEGHGLALVAGTGRVGHAFIAVDDVADFLAAAAVTGDAPSETLDIGGPEILTFNDAAALFARILGRRVRVLRTPAGVYWGLAALLAPFSPAASNLMAMSGLTAVAGTPFDTRDTARRFGVRQTSAEEFLRRQAALPED